MTWKFLMAETLCRWWGHKWTVDQGLTFCTRCGVITYEKEL